LASLGIALNELRRLTYGNISGCEGKNERKKKVEWRERQADKVSVYVES